MQPARDIIAIKSAAVHHLHSLLKNRQYYTSGTNFTGLGVSEGEVLTPQLAFILSEFGSNDINVKRELEAVYNFLNTYGDALDLEMVGNPRTSADGRGDYEAVNFTLKNFDIASHRNPELARNEFIKRLNKVYESDAVVFRAPETEPNHFDVSDPQPSLVSTAIKNCTVM